MRELSKTSERLIEERNGAGLVAGLRMHVHCIQQHREQDLGIANPASQLEGAGGIGQCGPSSPRARLIKPRRPYAFAAWTCGAPSSTARMNAFACSTQRSHSPMTYGCVMPAAPSRKRTKLRYP